MNVWRRRRGAIGITTLVAAMAFAVAVGGTGLHRRGGDDGHELRAPAADHIAQGPRSRRGHAQGRGARGVSVDTPARCTRVRGANFKPTHGPPWKIGMSNNEANLNAVRSSCWRA